MQRKQLADVNKEKGSQVRNRTKCLRWLPTSLSCLCVVHPKEVALVSSSQSCRRFKFRCPKAGPHPPKEQGQLPACLLSIVIITKGGHLWSFYNRNVKGLKKAEVNTLWPWIKSVWRVFVNEIKEWDKTHASQTACGELNKMTANQLWVTY